jgi:glycosyltransferase involved in cell wall biosynthesis
MEVFMPLTIVSIAYPLVPIGAETVGGTEQVLALLDEAIVRHGHRSIVIGAEGSKVAGTLAATPALKGSKTADQATWDWAYDIHRRTLKRLLETVDVDVVHMHGVDFQTYLPDDGTPVLATLHLPPFNYPEDICRSTRPLTMLNCVSTFSRRQYPKHARMTVVPNGIPLDRFRPVARSQKEDFVLALGRIVPEKGFHLAIDAAKSARLPLLIGGLVPPFPEHELYFEQEIRPRLDSLRRFVGPLTLAQRIDLLARARCVVVPSLVEETCSLAAIEALASGTPVVAHPIGALPENVTHRRTGFLVEDVHSMAQAMHEVTRTIDPDECRRVACQRFSAERMGRSYVEIYEMLSALGALQRGEHHEAPDDNRASTAP